MNKIKWLEIAFCQFLIAGCASQISMRPLTDSMERYQGYGFTVMPPRGNGWYIAEHPYQVAFTRGASPKDSSASPDPRHTYYLGVFVFEAKSGDKLDTSDDLAQIIAENMNGDNSNFKILESQTAPYSRKNAVCTRYRYVAKQRNHPQLPEVILLMTSGGFFCRHPYSQRLIINGVYSERRPSERQSVLDESLMKEAEDFFQTVDFSPIP